MISKIKNIVERSYYKTRIIITFCSVTILLVLLMTWSGYFFVEKMYIEQAAEKVTSVSKLLTSQIDKNYLDLLELGPPIGITQQYFSNILLSYQKIETGSQVFIFSNHLKIVVNANSHLPDDSEELQLRLNEKEISELSIDNTSVSLPFKGEDGNWYLWGFTRLTKNYWLGIRESASRLEKIDEMTGNFILIGLGGIIFTLLLGVIVAKSISKPIDKLAEYSAKIGEGNFENVLPIGIRGEIKILADALEKMKFNLARNQKEREEMLAQIAHEIRNPLGGIELLAGLTKEDMQNKSMSTDYIQKIINEVNLLKELITSFLEYGKPQPPNPENVHLKNIIADTISKLESVIRLKGIDLKMNLKISTVYFDPFHLQQILLNLLSNSVDWIPGKGKVLIESYTNNDRWEIKISDNGIGIPPENVKLIFNPFFSTKKNGTGLGLAICKKLCNENKCELSVENIYPAGTMFKISGEIKNEI